MARTESTMLPLGISAPDFTLPDTISGNNLHLKDIVGEKATVIMFICNHCPYVIHLNEELVNIANDYKAKGVGFIAISSNDVENYPQDGPELMKEHAIAVGYPFPYLYDETQDVAKSYDAACTPDFYIFDGDLKLVYRGRMDDSRPNSGTPVTGIDLRNSLDNILTNKDQLEPQLPSLGCNIKWK